MLLRNEIRRLLKMAATCHVGNRDKPQDHLKKKFAILFGKVNLISFFFILSVIKSNVVSHKVVKTSKMDKNAQTAIFENGTTLLDSFVQRSSTTVLETSKIHSNPITSSKLSILGNDLFLKVDGKLPTKNMQLLPYTATPNDVELKNLHYFSKNITTPLARPNIYSDILSNRRNSVVIQNFYNITCNINILNHVFL